VQWVSGLEPTQDEKGRIRFILRGSFNDLAVEQNPLQFANRDTPLYPPYRRVLGDTESILSDALDNKP